MVTVEGNSVSFKAPHTLYGVLYSLIHRGGATTGFYMWLYINIITKSVPAPWSCGFWYGKASEMAEKPIYSL